MTEKIMFLLVTVCLCLTAQGCTSRAWYEGLQNRERQEFYKSQNQGENQKCLERVNGTTYDQYKVEK